MGATEVRVRPTCDLEACRAATIKICYTCHHYYIHADQHAGQIYTEMEPYNSGLKHIPRTSMEIG